MSKRIQDLEKVYADNSIESPKFCIIFNDMSVKENDEFELENEDEYGIPFAEFIKQPYAYFETETDWDNYIVSVQHATDK